ncbi:MAG TPA: hypothetical protein VF808_16150 [Ktedonobacterales bacterium]
MGRFRNYWIYSAGLAITWAIILTIATSIHGARGVGPYWLVFGGYAIGWVSTTIARYIYPPPRRWGATRG